MKESEKEMNLNRKKSVVLTALLVAFTAFAGCLGDDEISCGEGTELVDGECVSITNGKESNTITLTLIGRTCHLLVTVEMLMVLSIQILVFH